jgi:hypothetical protein
MWLVPRRSAGPSNLLKSGLTLNLSVLHRDRVQCSVINTPIQPDAGVPLEIIMAKAIIQAITADDIDNLGILLADISRLTKEADAIKARLKEGGLDSYDGEVFRAVVVKQDRTSYDPRKVEELLGDLISQVEKISAVVSVKVTARKS